MPQNSLPAKQGVSTNPPKLFRKIDSLNYEVIQKADKGYLRYKFHKANDDSSVSYGGNWELLRLFAVQQMLDVFLWKEPVPVTGTLTTAVAASTFNSIESNLTYKAPSSVEGNRTGLTLYDLASGTEATFTLASRKKGKANILFNANTGRSTKMEIYVNDVLVKSFSSNLGGVSGNYQIVEFPIPSTVNSAETCTVKIKNTDTVTFSLVCFNFYILDEYEEHEIDSYKLLLNNSYFINETDASDYALRTKILISGLVPIMAGKFRSI